MKLPVVINKTSVYVFAFHSGRALKASAIQMGGIFMQALSSVVRDYSTLTLILNPDNSGLSNLTTLHSCIDYFKSRTNPFFFSKGPESKIFRLCGTHPVCVAYSSLLLFFITL